MVAFGRRAFLSDLTGAVSAVDVGAHWVAPSERPDRPVPDLALSKGSGFWRRRMDDLYFDRYTI